MTPNGSESPFVRSLSSFLPTTRVRRPSEENWLMWSMFGEPSSKPTGLPASVRRRRSRT